MRLRMVWPMEINPIHLKQANDFVKQYHRHNIPTVGGKFAISAKENGEIVGVAICGRPVARKLDDGEALEIYRCCCKNGTKNACSMLYGACCRIAKNMGYKTVITYTLETENGASLKASGFQSDGKCGGTHWTGKRKREYFIAPEVLKVRWIKNYA